MPKLSSQFKHEEPELNSSLQIRSSKERRAKSEEQWTTAGMLFLRALFMPPASTVHPVLFLFHAFVVFVTFFFSSHFVLVIAFSFSFFGNFIYTKHLYKP